MNTSDISHLIITPDGRKMGKASDGSLYHIEIANNDLDLLFVHARQSGIPELKFIVIDDDSRTGIGIDGKHYPLNHLNLIGGLGSFLDIIKMAGKIVGKVAAGVKAVKAAKAGQQQDQQEDQQQSFAPQAPVYRPTPAPVYKQPAPVYQQAPIYQPAPVYQYQQPIFQNQNPNSNQNQSNGNKWVPYAAGGAGILLFGGLFLAMRRPESHHLHGTPVVEKKRRRRVNRNVLKVTF